jgi:hypothetical protein
MDLIKGDRFSKFLNRLDSASKDSVDIGWFAEQGYHYSGLSYPDLAQVHFNGLSVPKRDILGVALFLHNPATDRDLKNIIKSWIGEESGRSEELYEAIGMLEKHNVKKSFGSPVLGVTNNPTPLLDTGDWKENTRYKVESKGTLK